MFSETIKEALKQEVVGQPHAINTVVRGVTRLLSGMTPRERSWCVYLFVGPPGTGRAHLVRTLARGLHGEEAVFTLNCNSGGLTDPWTWFSQQLTPLLMRQAQKPGKCGSQPPSILLVQDLECAQKELHPLLARFLETGQLALPGGQRGRLENCLIFMTSGLCTQEILDETSRFGFTGSASEEEDGEEEDALVKTCRTEAESVFGLDLLAQIDDLVVFRRLEEEHLASVLERHFARMGRWLEARGIQCDLEPAAKAFLLECGTHQKLLGARDLILAHRRQVEFPVADLLLSKRLEAGGGVVVDRRPDEAHLHFTVLEPDGAARASAHGVHEVPVG